VMIVGGAAGFALVERFAAAAGLAFAFAVPWVGMFFSS
jgi:hypothetical protein